MKNGKGNGTSLTSGKGMDSYAKNPLAQPSRVRTECGPGLNADQRKANRLLQEAQRKVDSQRGQTGM